MNNRITELEINNFKSIKHIKMDCKRINVLIGKPNVGKSNILEALSLYTSQFNQPNKKFLEDYVRYEKILNLFYDLDRRNQVVIKSNLGFAALRFHMNNINAYDVVVGPDITLLHEMNQSETGEYNINDRNKFFIEQLTNIENEAKSIKPYYSSIEDNGNSHSSLSNNNSGYNTPIKKYHFKSLTKYNNHFPLFLLPPNGDNFFTILESDRKLWGEFAGIFSQYGLDLLVDKENEKLDIQKKEGIYVTKIPYSLMADTLQRYIFHLAAIESNTDSILLFEEPESHSFPPYISKLADKIIEDKNNQFFIATHSPYLLTPFIEQCDWSEVAIFIASYENYETKIKLLSEEEMQNLLDTKPDLFFNLRAFS